MVTQRTLNPLFLVRVQAWEIYGVCDNLGSRDRE